MRADRRPHQRRHWRVATEVVMPCKLRAILSVPWRIVRRTTQITLSTPYQRKDLGHQATTAMAITIIRKP